MGERVTESCDGWVPGHGAWEEIAGQLRWAAEESVLPEVMAESEDGLNSDHPFARKVKITITVESER